MPRLTELLYLHIHMLCPTWLTGRNQLLHSYLRKKIPKMLLNIALSVHIMRNSTPCISVIIVKIMKYLLCTNSYRDYFIFTICDKICHVVCLKHLELLYSSLKKYFWERKNIFSYRNLFRLNFYYLGGRRIVVLMFIEDCEGVKTQIDT